MALNDIGQKAANSWIHDILIWGGAKDRATSQRKYYDYPFMYNSADPNKMGKQNAEKVCSFLIQVFSKNKLGASDITSVGQALNYLSIFQFSLLDNTKTWKSSKPETLASFIAYFINSKSSQSNNIWIRLRNTSLDEITSIVTGLSGDNFGKILWDEKCFYIQNSDNPKDKEILQKIENKIQEYGGILPANSIPSTPKTSNQTDASNTSNNTNSSNSQATSGSASGNGNTTANTDPTQAQSATNSKSIKGVKQKLGPLSGIVPNLIGNPHEKIYLQDIVYFIRATDSTDSVQKNFLKNKPADATAIANDPNAKGNKSVVYPKAYVTLLWPLQNVDKRGTMRDDGVPKRVNFSGGQGGQDMVIFLESASEADEFCAKCEQKNISIDKRTHPGNSVTHFRAYPQRPDKNGYFKIETEFGPAYVKASNLNEELLEFLKNKESNQNEN